MRGLLNPQSLAFEIPAGPIATRETLKHMRQLTQAGKMNFRLRDLANNITAGATPKNWEEEIGVIFDFVRIRIRYALDPNDLELIQGPAQTLRLGYGDCDDMSILLATLLESVGHLCAFMAIGFQEVGEYSHVIVICSGAGETEWIALDPTEPHPAGWFPPDATCIMLAPITQPAADMLQGEP